MTEKRTTFIKRTVFLVIMVIITAFLILFSLFMNSRSGYAVNLDPINTLTAVNPESAGRTEAIEEPADLPKIIRLTFGGSCTPAAPLGTDSYGTFNHVAAENGCEVFLAGLAPLFNRDNCTVLGCAAVLSDDDLPFTGTAEDPLPYRGHAENAEVFALAGVDLLSVNHERTAAYGDEGIAATKSALENADLFWTDTYKAFYTEEAGIRIGILGAGITEISDTEGLISWAAKAAESCGYVVLYAERGSGSDEYYREIACRLIDAGCDLVCYAGHPGESGFAAETYNNGIILNSLGYLLDGGAYTAAETALFRVTMSVEDEAIVLVEGEVFPVTYGENPWIPQIE